MTTSSALSTAPPPAYESFRISTAAGALHAARWRSAVPVPRVPIVLMHESLGCESLWRDFPERLAAATGRDVIAYDRLGFGRSDPRHDRLPVSFVSDEARTGFAAVMHHFDLKRFAVFGHSVGGGMAIGVAAHWRDRCEALITESAQAFVEDLTLRGLRQADIDFHTPAQMARLERHHGDKAAWLLDAWLGTWLSPAFADFSVDGNLALVRCPVLALHGDADEYGSHRHPERIAAGVADGRCVLLPNCGHVPHREQQDLVLDRVAAFLGAAGSSAAPT